MISVPLIREDLEHIRFTYSPLATLATSYRLLQNRDKHSLQRAWSTDAERALADVPLDWLTVVIPAHHYMADFATPTPLHIERDIEADFERMRATPAEIIRANIIELNISNGEHPLRQQFLAYPHEMMECLIEVMRLYWQRTLEMHWARIQTVLENDILFQARTQVMCGVDSVLNSFADYMQYQDGLLVIRKRHVCKPEESTFTPAGIGIHLVPTVFKGSEVSYQFTPDWQPMILYGARGAGLWYQQRLPEPETALRAAFGDSRAVLLATLTTPAHTAELATRLGITSGAVSQQLSKLLEAGLVENHRSGYRVYYRLSERGEKLVELFTA
jgi:DNA-binding transcriptional ArsR family regulator